MAALAVSRLPIRPAFFLGGAVAQLGERLVRNEEVRGSTPLGSTSLRSLRELRLGKRRGHCRFGWHASLTSAKVALRSSKSEGGRLRARQAWHAASYSRLNPLIYGCVDAGVTRNDRTCD